MAAVLTADRTEPIDQALDELEAGERAWAAFGNTQRAALLDRMHAAVAANAEDWVRQAAAYKSLPAGSPLLGEEWTSGPYALLTATDTLAASLRALAAGHSPAAGYPVRPAPGGRTAVSVLPHTAFDRLLLSGFSAEVWLDPGADPATAGLASKDPAQTHGIGVVLGAGNITSIPLLDVLYELFAHNRVVALKLNPVMEGMAGVFAAVLKPFTDIGAVRLIPGAGDIGSYLVHHDKVVHVHITGSARTHDAIVAGPPALTKEISSELGGVSPVLVLPGTWSTADLKFQAEHVATQRLHNGGYNCIATQVAVISADWPQKEEFKAALRDVLAAAPGRAAYYPGSDDRVAGACAAYPDAATISGRVLIENLEPDGPALTTEYFAPVLGVLELPGTGKEFLDKAVEMANERFAGTLGVNLIADPATVRALGPALEAAIAALRYGTVAVNAWTALGFLTPAATWGAYPGHTVAEIGSGIGIVHNALLLDHAERTVVRGPFRPFPRLRPPWFVTNKAAAKLGANLTSFAARPRWSALPKIFASAMRG
jgi:aldehyde dehydrogenase (NAD(P)+)